MLYIAYGSNLHLPSMAGRCPAATVVGGAALKGYDLRFRSGLATVEPSEGGAVPVLAWEIDGRGELALDQYEGYPRLYRRELHPVELNGETVDAMVYVMNSGHPYGEPNAYFFFRPSKTTYIKRQNLAIVKGVIHSFHRTLKNTGFVPVISSHTSTLAVRSVVSRQATSEGTPRLPADRPIKMGIRQNDSIKGTSGKYLSVNQPVAG